MTSSSKPWTVVAMLIAALGVASCQAPSSDDTAGRGEGPPAVGKGLYLASCAACHGPTGQGLAGSFPPLAGSDFIATNRDSAIRAILDGLQGPITVNGKAYDGAMPGFGHLGDAEIAAIASYVFSSWGNRVDTVSPDEVAALRRTASPD